jgi:hypothetical protein
MNSVISYTITYHTFFYYYFVFLYNLLFILTWFNRQRINNYNILNGVKRNGLGLPPPLEGMFIALGLVVIVFLFG